MAKTMKEILAEKKAKAAGGGNSAAPTNKGPAVKKAAPKAAPVEEEEEQQEGDDGEGEEEEAPAPKKPAAKTAAKGNAKAPAKKPVVVQEEEEGEEEGAEGEGEESEGEGEEGGDEGDGEEGEGEGEEEAEEEAPAPKKNVKAPVKPAAKTTTTKAAPAAPAKKPTNAALPAPANGKKSAWGAKKDVKQVAELKPGQWMTQDRLIDLIHGRLESESIAPPTKSVTAAVFKSMEAVIGEVLQYNDLKLFGVKTKRRAMESRVYAPNPGLEKVATPYHTLVLPHTKVTLSLYFDKATVRGRVDDSGTFVEGMFNEANKFVRGTWKGDEFTPAASAKKPTNGKK